MESLHEDLLYMILSKIPEEYTTTVEVCKRWKTVQSMEYFKTECSTCIEGHKYSLFNAAHHNHKRCFMYLLKHFPVSTKISYIHGDVEDQKWKLILSLIDFELFKITLKQLCEDGFCASKNKEVCIQTASTGRLEFLKEVVEHGCPIHGPFLDRPVEVSYVNNIDCLRYIHEQGFPWDATTCKYASGSGHLDCLRYAHENGCTWDKTTCQIAIRKCCLECLRYAHENGCPWNEWTCIFALSGGHLDCLIYAHEHGCPWSAFTCEFAAQNGQLEYLQYLHEHGCPWNSNTCICAITYEHLDCLRYAHENGCPWDKEYFLLIAKNPEIIQYIQTH